MKTKAKHVGWVFEAKHYPEDIGPVFDTSPKHGALSEEHWTRRPVFTLDPEPEIEVDLADEVA